MDSITVAGSLESLPAIAEYVLRAADEAGLDEKTTYRLRLAVDEVATNIILHGYQERGLRGDVRLDAVLDDHVLSVRLEDSATPFDPMKASPPHDLAKPLADRAIGGLGVYLARQEVDRWDYERVDDRNVNTLAVRRPTAPTRARGPIPSANGAAVPAEDVSLTAASHDAAARDLLRVLVSLGVALSGERNFGRLLERILTEAKALCRADGGTLYVRTPDDTLQFAIMSTDSLGFRMGGTTGKPIPFAPLPLVDPETGGPNLRNVSTRSAIERRSINIDDIYTAEGFNFAGTRAFDTANGYRSRSLLTVPLLNHEGDAIGVLQLVNARDAATDTVVPFRTAIREIVECLASQAAVALSNNLLLDRQRELLKFERDVQIGRQIQADFLPEAIPNPPGWEIAACFRPARQVAGDFYDVFPLPGGRIALVIGDVCDKGVGAALFMAIFRTMIRSFAQQSCSAWGRAGCPGYATREDPSKLAMKNAVELTNDYIARIHSRSSMFATIFFAALDPATGVLTYGNGGHEPPVLFGPGGEVKARLLPLGPAVGIEPGAEMGTREVTLGPDDTLLAYTDGVTEARDPKRAFFTEARLLQLLKEPASAQSLLDRIEGSLARHVAGGPQWDDITLLAIRRPVSMASTTADRGSSRWAGRSP